MHCVWCIVCGTFVWYICVVHLCGTFVWYIVVHFFVVHCLLHMCFELHQNVTDRKIRTDTTNVLPLQARCYRRAKYQYAVAMNSIVLHYSYSKKCSLWSFVDVSMWRCVDVPVMCTDPSFLVFVSSSSPHHGSWTLHSTTGSHWKFRSLPVADWAWSLHWIDWIGTVQVNAPTSTTLSTALSAARLSCLLSSGNWGWLSS